LGRGIVWHWPGAAVLVTPLFRLNKNITDAERTSNCLRWYAILVESSGLSVARRSTKTNQNLNHDLRFRLDRCLADPSNNHPALRHRITSATRQTP